MSLPCVFLFRPVSIDDPIFIQSQGECIFPRIMKELVKQSVVSQVIVSIPSDTPKPIIDTLKSWGVTLDTEGPDAPPQRLKHLMAAHGLHQVICCTSYNFFILGEAVKKAGDCLNNKDADVVITDGVITAKHFCALNIKAVEHLCRQAKAPVAPNRFHEFMESETVTTVKLSGLESCGEKFLWDLHYAGAKQQLPKQVVIQLINKIPADKWFDQETFAQLLLWNLNISTWDWLDRTLEKNRFLCDKAMEFAAQFAWFTRWAAHIPPKGGSFVELGFGDFPVISTLLLHFFTKGIAIEPRGFNAAHISPSVDLAGQLLQQISLLRPPGIQRLQQSKKKLLTESAFLEALALPGNSIDFCFSKTVFEHIEDIDSISDELYRILTPGGVMIHEIDFSDHRLGNTIHFNFLKYSGQAWRAKKMGTNLFRISDYLSLWDEKGFSTQVLLRHDTTIAPPEMHPSWNRYAQKDLLCHTAVIKAVKKA